MVVLVESSVYGFDARPNNYFVRIWCHELVCTCWQVYELGEPAPSPVPPIITDDYAYVGCYGDDVSDRVLTGIAVKKDTAMTTQVRCVGEASLTNNHGWK